MALGACLASMACAVYSQPVRSDASPLDAAFAQTQILTLQGAQELALRANPTLAAAQREVDATQGQVLQSQARPNPELSYLQEDTRRESRTQTLQFNLPIELGGKRSARMAVAERSRDIAMAQLSARRAELRSSVAAAFFEGLTAQQRAALAKDLVDLARRATDAVAKRVMAGKVSPVEETKARVAEAGALVELSQARSELRMTEQRLAALLGDSHRQMWRLEGPSTMLPSVPNETTLAQRLSRSSALQQAELELQRRQALVQVERSRQAPDITVSLGVKRPNELQRDQMVVGVSVPIPVFDRNQGNLIEALRREDKSRDELLATRLGLENQVNQARERLIAALAETELLRREVLPGGKSAYEAAVTGFEFGKFSFLEVLDAQRTYFNAQSQVFRAIADAHRAAADIDRVLGSTADPMLPQE